MIIDVHTVSIQHMQRLKLNKKFCTNLFLMQFTEHSGKEGQSEEHKFTSMNLAHKLKFSRRFKGQKFSAEKLNKQLDINEIVVGVLGFVFGGGQLGFVLGCFSLGIFLARESKTSQLYYFLIFLISKKGYIGPSGSHYVFGI